MRVLITGISGFIGKSLAEELTHTGIEVVGLSRKTTDAKLPYKVITGDVLDTKVVSSLMTNVDCVVHLAAITSHDEIISNKFKTLEVNLLGTKAVLEAFNKSASAKIFIYSSSGKVYGKAQALPITEEHSTNPLNILGKTKLLAEQLIDFYSGNEKSYVILRLFNLFGENQTGNFLIPTILSQLKNSKTITLGDINSKRDFLHVGNFVDLITKILKEDKLKKGLQKYNVCSGKAVSTDNIIKMIEEILGKKIVVKIDEKRFRSDEADVEYGSYEKARINFNWEQKINLQEGLRKVLKANDLL